MDPSVAMAKAYCKEKKEDEKEKKSHEGPLAFLGLQRKSVDAEPKDESKNDDDKETLKEDPQNESESMDVDDKEKKESNDEHTEEQKDCSQTTEENGQTEEQEGDVAKTEEEQKEDKLQTQEEQTEDKTLTEEHNEDDKKDASQPEAELGAEDVEGLEKDVFGDEETEEKPEEEEQTKEKEVENEIVPNDSHEQQVNDLISTFSYFFNILNFLVGLNLDILSLVLPHY